MKRPLQLTDAMIAQIVDRLRSDRTVRRALPGWGRIAIERRLPFIVVYRRPSGGHDSGTDRLPIGTASYLLAPTDPIHAEQVDRLLGAIAGLMRETFGAFLIIEVWASVVSDGRDAGPEYRVCHRAADGLDDVADEIASALGESRIMGRTPTLSTDACSRIAPPGMRQLMTVRRRRSLGASLIGVEVAPIYRAPDSDETYPAVLRQMRRRTTIAFDRALYRFIADHTTQRPLTHQALRRTAFTKSVGEIDAELAAVGERFDTLLQVTPVNVEEQWLEFRRRRYAHPPRFRYRPLPFDPGRMKHRLWAIRPERIEDPTLMYLFRGVQRHLDRELTLVSDIGRPEFLHTSLQLHGGVETGLKALADHLLDTLPRRPKRRGATLSAEQFAELVGAEIHAYRQDHPGFGFMPRVREDLYAGLLVSHGHLFIGARSQIPARRADALIQHEIGTHVVTFHNGRNQPFRLLSLGLPGYDEMQEGLAVLGEYLVGGLDAERLRVLAARVVAVNALTDGADFIETFRMLVEKGFSKHAAFTITTRVYRGGGLAKDAMYLRGLAGVLDYLAEGCDVTTLFVGKYGVKHVPVIEELLLRKVLVQPEVLPRYLHRADAAERLERVRAGIAVTDLVKDCAR